MTAKKNATDEAAASSPSAAATKRQPQQHHDAPSSTSPGQNDSSSELFSELSAMHLTAGSSHPHLQQQQQQQQQQQHQSRKRKIHGGGSGGSFSGKLNHLRAPSAQRGSPNDDDDPPLHTPLCSQSGYADEEDQQHSLLDTHLDQDHGHGGHAANPQQGGGGSGAATQSRIRNISISALVNGTHPLMSEIDENLAADFDGSFSGLGVDMNASNYSMSEALMALPNLSISSSQMFKQEAASPTHSTEGKQQTPVDDDVAAKAAKTNGDSRTMAKRQHLPPAHQQKTSQSSSAPKSMIAKNLEALDLSNDEAHFPESAGSDDRDLLSPKATVFTGSVLKEASLNDGGLEPSVVVNFSGSHPNISLAGGPSSTTTTTTTKKGSSSKRTMTIHPQPERRLSSPTSKGESSAVVQAHRVILPLQQQSVKSESKSCPTMAAAEEPSTERFQCILAAPTSNATKVHEPSITYLNQGQAYELRLKKLGDLSGLKKRRLLCKLRICFHDRRLQYMELEQLVKWSSEHSGERILDLDVPLSYGIIDPFVPPFYDPAQINTASFWWDPTRDTGAFVKVNCISTEFTPKKHGGERGVPFRLQVEMYDEDVATGGEQRLHASGCILQIFKLKGADRKHKQDRDKISKRPAAEQEKFAPSYDCTMLTDLSPDNVYVAAPSSTATTATSTTTTTTTMASASSRAVTPQATAAKNRDDCSGSPIAAIQDEPAEKVIRRITATSTPEAVTSWLCQNRLGNHLSTFRNFNGRDMLRLLRDEVTALCGVPDGIRLHNELHDVAVAPYRVLYVAPKGAAEYSALFLEEASTEEFVLRLSLSIGLPASIFGRLFMIGPHRIVVRVTNQVLEQTKSGSVFQFSLRPAAVATPGSSSSDDFGNVCDVVLEDLTPVHVVDDHVFREAAQQEGATEHGGGYLDGATVAAASDNPHGQQRQSVVVEHIHPLPDHAAFINGTAGGSGLRSS